MKSGRFIDLTKVVNAEELEAMNKAIDQEERQERQAQQAKAGRPTREQVLEDAKVGLGSCFLDMSFGCESLCVGMVCLCLLDLAAEVKCRMLAAV